MPIRELISMDFFTVPSATFRVLFVFVLLSHECRRTLHFNVTEHPTSWLGADGSSMQSPSRV